MPFVSTVELPSKSTTKSIGIAMRKNSNDNTTGGKVVAMRDIKELEVVKDGV